MHTGVGLKIRRNAVEAGRGNRTELGKGNGHLDSVVGKGRRTSLEN